MLGDAAQIGLPRLDVPTERVRPAAQPPVERGQPLPPTERVQPVPPPGRVHPAPPTERVRPVPPPARGRQAPPPFPTRPRPFPAGAPRPMHPGEAPTEVMPPVPAVVEDPTELIPAVPAVVPAVDYPADDYADSYEDDYADQDDDQDDDQDYEDEPDDRAKPKPPRATVGSTVVQGVGELMVTLGVVVLLFVLYEVWVTDLVSAGKQRDVTSALDQQWQGPNERTQKFSFADGEGMAKLYIPALGEDYRFTIVEGTSNENLEVGPGHYKHSALPGEPGNFAVAGHRVGKGAPFNDLDLLQACDAIVVETQTGWFVYRMLPTEADARDWATRGADPLCSGVEPLTGPYAAAVGRQIVTPKDSEVVAPVPTNPGSTLPEAERRKLITLTTCHPKFSNKQRMILHGILVREQQKNPADPSAVPPELRETR
ncbi:LPXTG-site transpeptidase (sortase) family protein [Actinokineospora iranica]|uniref:LPXTG-site transpeptidase (Sortase) family protein n=1 Tax=Actinokineospora iranica TaxID=1271860 RepID=A0A1G6WYS7_9PSEU|nr:LPXTG-site transpeptidase (sortase) family protein [Actinokineospora iranica]